MKKHGDAWKFNEEVPQPTDAVSVWVIHDHPIGEPGTGDKRREQKYQLPITRHIALPKMELGEPSRDLAGV
jgi:hypothetical protein